MSGTWPTLWIVAYEVWDLNHVIYNKSENLTFCHEEKESPAKQAAILVFSNLLLWHFRCELLICRNKARLDAH